MVCLVFVGLPRRCLSICSSPALLPRRSLLAAVSHVLFLLLLPVPLLSSVTKNCGVTCVTSKIHERVNFVWNLLVYLISAVSA